MKFLTVDMRNSPSHMRRNMYEGALQSKALKFIVASVAVVGIHLLALSAVIYPAQEVAVSNGDRGEVNGVLGHPIVIYFPDHNKVRKSLQDQLHGNRKIPIRPRKYNTSDHAENNKIVSDSASTGSANLGQGRESARSLEYLKAKDLSVRPSLIENSPINDVISLSPGVDEVVDIILFISESGDVAQAIFSQEDIVKRFPEMNILLQRFMLLKFTPGKLHGKPVRSQLKIQVEVMPISRIPL